MIMKNNDVIIAVAGHTNTGKTTLIRTLIREPIGEVKDEANVTKVNEEVSYPALQATFIDCPGFQNPGLFRSYLQIKETDGEAIAQKIIKNIKPEYTEYNKIALKGIGKADVIFYVVPLNAITDDDFNQELCLVLGRNDKVIGIINKEQSQRMLTNMDVDARIKQWKEYFERNGVIRFVLFDSHWDKPSKAHILYSLTAELLTGDKKNSLYAGLESLTKNWNDRRYDLAKKSVNFIDYCRNLKIEESNTSHGLNNDKTKYAIQKKLSAEIIEQSVIFFCDIAKFYKLSSELQPKDILKHPSFDSVVNTGTISKIISGAVIGGTGGAIIGAIIGAVILGVAAGLIGGPAGAVVAAEEGALMGAEAFAALCGVSGATNVAVMRADEEEDRTFTGQLHSKALENVAIHIVAGVWSIAYHGYGMGTLVTNERQEKLITELNSISKQKFNQINFKSDSHEKIESWFRGFFTELEI